MIPNATRQLLIDLADLYEAPSFLIGDPSWFMHQVSEPDNQEAMAFLASCLSYGSRQQFMPKIQWLLNCSNGKIHNWIRSGDFTSALPKDSPHCFYRLYTVGQMHTFLQVYKQLLHDYGSLKIFVKHHATDGYTALNTICQYFADRGTQGVIPQNTQSACKRLCMFLRWMVRNGSPVDLGLWSDIIDPKTLIMPLDTHVLTQSKSLGLLQSGAATMAAARRLTRIMADIFPNDPLKGDFALFGYGINHGQTANHPSSA